MSTTSNVVIVGAGLAGLMCAYRLVQQQQAVTVVYQGDIHHIRHHITHRVGLHVPGMMRIRC